MENEDLTSEEIKMFKDLRDKTVTVNVETEDLVVRSLIGQGLLKKNTARISLLRIAASVAAAAVIFWSGMLAGANNIDNDYNYVLLLYHGSNYLEGDPSQRFMEYRSWMRDLERSGIRISGEKVDDAAKVAEKDTVYAAPPDGVSGLFLVNGSEDEIIKIANQSPHVKYGGRIEIRKIVNK